MPQFSKYSITGNISSVLGCCFFFPILSQNHIISLQADMDSFPTVTPFYLFLLYLTCDFSHIHSYHHTYRKGLILTCFLPLMMTYISCPTLLHLPTEDKPAETHNTPNRCTPLKVLSPAPPSHPPLHTPSFPLSLTLHKAKWIGLSVLWKI